MTVGNRFVVTSGVLLLLSVVSALVSVWGFYNVRRDTRSVSAESVPGAMLSQTMDMDVMDIRVLYLRELLSSSDNEAQQLDAALGADYDKLAADMKKYEGTISDEEDRNSFKQLNPELVAAIEGWEKVLAAKGTSKDQAYQVYAAEVQPHLDSLREHTHGMAEWNRNRLENTMGSTVQISNRSVWLTALLSVVALLVGIGLSWVMVRMLNRQLKRVASDLGENASQIFAAAAQVSSSSQSLARGASDQAASIEETSASGEEINSMARKNAGSCHSMSELVSEAQGLVSSANRKLEEMVVSMDTINESSAKISKIIKVIDEITFQTNILALNAAVEAARAGEAGAGFAVVAGEVRNLAQRSTQAAKDTASLIEESIAKSNEGKVKVAEVAGAISAVTADFDKIKVLVDEVDHGSQEQSRGLDHVAKAITQMEQLTQTTAAGAEESAAAAAELNAQSDSLKGVVLEMNQLIGVKDAEELGSQSTNRREAGHRRKAAIHAEPPASAQKRRQGSLPMETAFTEF
ncbi:MAG TPA: methyl-accepting chemotaxis protein [Terracidiphilus sp.]|nr:methyl-accepting chemotaxis protein [Terracidiphilus sp.]